MNIKALAILVTTLASLSGCQVAQPEITNPVTWYAVNGWSESVSFDMYDYVCERTLPDMRLRPGREVAVTTCGNAQGRAAIRYRREGLATTATPWSQRRSIGAGSRVFLQ